MHVDEACSLLSVILVIVYRLDFIFQLAFTETFAVFVPELKCHLVCPDEGAVVAAAAVVITEGIVMVAAVRIVTAEMMMIITGEEGKPCRKLMSSLSSL